MFVVLPYNKTSSKLEVNESRFELFSAMNRQIDNIPPTATSLVEHTKRAVLQANIWHQIDRKETNELDPASFGWRAIEGKWKPHWSDLPEVSNMCHELIKCGCRQCKPSSCKCRQEDLPCSLLCKCGGNCQTFINPIFRGGRGLFAPPQVFHLLLLE